MCVYVAEKLNQFFVSPLFSIFLFHRYIKMSSPYLNNLIIIGCILTYTSVIFLGLDSSLTSVQTFPYICAARAWLLMAGFSLAFGAMFSKTWRVHSIFTDVKLNKKVILFSFFFLKYHSNIFLSFTYRNINYTIDNTSIYVYSFHNFYNIHPSTNSRISPLLAYILFRR